MAGETEFRAWVEQLETRLWADTAGGALEPKLREPIAILKASETRLVFAGHFKSGKSTLLNAALGRALLPTYSLPETGAACLLRAGDQDEAFLCTGDTREALPCTTEGIEAAIALLSPTGERRVEVGAIDRIEIRLAHSLLPAGVCWIDTPGINDSLAMDARATSSARGSDLLFWVLNSKQILAEVESAFLAEHIAANGPGSVVFLLNVFLEQDDLPTWQAYCQRQVPRLCAKVVEVAPQIGFDPSYPPQIVPVSARAVGTQRRPENVAEGSLSLAPGSDFGAAEMQALLSPTASSTQARIRHTRCLRASAVLSGLAAEMTLRCERAKKSLEKEQAAWKTQNRKVEAQRRAYATAVTNSVNACLADFEADMEILCASLKANLAAHAHETPDAFNQRFNGGLTAAVEARAEALLAAGTAALRKADCRPLKKAQQNQIRKILAATPVCFEVAPAHVNREEILTSAGVGAVAAGIIPGLGHLVGGLIGAGVGYLKARSDAEYRHTAILTTHIDEATSEAVASLQSRRKALTNYLLKWGCPRQPVPDAPETTQLQTLSGLRDELKQFAREAGHFADEALLEIQPK